MWAILCHQLTQPHYVHVFGLWEQAIRDSKLTVGVNMSEWLCVSPAIYKTEQPDMIYGSKHLLS